MDTKFKVMVLFRRTIGMQGFMVLVILGILYAGTLFSTAFSDKPEAWPPQQETQNGLVGAASCRPCHQGIYNSLLRTAHYRTSGPGESKYIKGSFEEGKNVYNYNVFTQVVLEKDDSGHYQTSVISGSPLQSERIDIVVGSGRKGQTFLYWKGDQLLQLPISYYTPTHSWCNSPGYPTTLPLFNRIIPGRCLECHGSYAKMLDKEIQPVHYDKNSLVLGIDCERCHGPGKLHVEYHSANVGESGAKFMQTKDMLSRQQSLDLCGLCHGGLRKAIKPPFTYTAGDKLTDYSLPNYDEDSTAMLDVHGNQNGLLAASACFKKSEMNCASCHNVHKEEYNQPKLYSSRCLNCHGGGNTHTCKLPNVEGLSLSDNCIDCHMPMLPSKNIFLETADRSKSSADFVRTHRVAIYPEATRAFLSKFQTKPAQK